MRSAPHLRFVIGFLFLLIAIAGQLKMSMVLGFSINWTLGVLFVLAGFLSGPAFVFSTIFTTWLFRFSIEGDTALWLFGTLPLVAFFLQRLLPWQSWINSALTTSLGMSLFYVLVSPSFIVNHLSFFLIDILLSLLGGMIVFFTFEEIYPAEAGRSRAESLRRGYIERR